MPRSRVKFIAILFFYRCSAACFRNSSDYVESSAFKYTNELIVSPEILLQWEKNVSSNLVSFQLTNKAFGFVALGFSTSPSMIGSDGIIIEPGLADAFCPINQIIIKGKSKNLIAIVNESESSLIHASNQFQFSHNGWIAQFSRSIDVFPNQVGQVSLLQAKFLVVAWSSTTDVITKHTNTRIFALDLLERGASEYLYTQQLMKIGHGICMTIAWAIIVPIGIAVARYGKFSSFRGHPRDELSTSRWLMWHRRIQYVAWSLFVVGFLTIFVSKGENEHFKSTHAIVGLILVLFGILQPLTSFCRGRIHRIPGYLCVSSAMANIFVGLISLNVASLYRRSYEAYLSIVVIIYVLLELRLYLQQQLQRHGPREPL